MSTPSDDKKEPSGFWASFDEGYKEEDEKIRQDTAPIEQKIAEGVVTGVVETVAHPFRWLRSVLK